MTALILFRTAADPLDAAARRPSERVERLARRQLEVDEDAYDPDDQIDHERLRRLQPHWPASGRLADAAQAYFGNLLVQLTDDRFLALVAMQLGPAPYNPIRQRSLVPAS